MTCLLLWAAIMLGLAVRIAITYRRYNQAGLITGNRAASYIRAASADIDRRRR